MSTPSRAAAVLRHLRRLTAQPVEGRRDSELLERFLVCRDEAAFAALVKRHGPMVLHVCRGVLRHAHDAEDAFQATFLALACRADSVRRRDSLAGWLHAVAYHVALKARARAARRRTLEVGAPEAAATDPLLDLTVRELHLALHEELGRLPEKYRAPLVLCYLEGKTYAEAARQLGWTRWRVQGLLERGRARLRERLVRRGLALSAVPLTLALTRPVPAALVDVTTEVARACTAGQAAAPVAALAKSGLRALFLSKVKAAAMLPLVLGLVAASAGMLLHQGEPAKPEEPRAPAAQTRTDQQGDALPVGVVFRFGSIRLRHETGIGNSALSPDGRYLATAASRSVAVWDLESEQRLHHFRCDHGFNFSRPGLTFSPDGMRLGYVRSSRFACAWDLRTGREVWRLDGEKNIPTALCRFTADGKELILSRREMTNFWDLDTGHIKHTIPVGFVSLLSPDARTYVRLEERKAVVFGDARTGKETERWHIAAAHSGIENGFAFAPDGRTVAVAETDKEIQLRDFPGGQVRFAIPIPEALKRPGGRSSIGSRFGFTVDGRTLLCSSEDGWIHRWDLAAKKELPALKQHFGLYTNSDPASSHSLPDGRTLVSAGADGLIRRWDLPTGRELSKPEGYVGRTYAAYAPNGRYVAVGDRSGRVDLWDAASGKLLRALRAHGPAVLSLAFAPDGNTVAVAQTPATVQLYEVPGGREGPAFPYDGDHERPYAHALRFSPDGGSLCVCHTWSPLHLLDVATGMLRWRGHSTSAVAFSPDGSTLAVGYGRDLKFVDAATGKERSRAQLNSNQNEGLLPHVDAVAFSPDGRRLAVALFNGHILFCDGATGAEVRRFKAVDERKLSPDDIHLRLRGEGYRVYALAFSADGKWLASGGSDRAVRIWEVATAAEVLRRDGHEGDVSNIAFGPDGRSVLSCGEDAQAYLWSPRPKVAPVQRLDDLAAGLGDADAAVAYRAIWALSEDPAAAAFLREKIVPVKLPEKDQLAKLLADLASDRFAVRDAASKALAELGGLAVPALEEALKSQPTPEARRRLQTLLDGLRREPSLPELRRLRAVQALELAGTAEARATLRAWTGGAAGDRLTEDAKAALGRLEKRASP